MTPAWLTAVPFAHRGLHAPDTGRAENTLPAFAAAAERGYGIELDVRLSADGVPVVFHDATLDRVTFGRGPVAALPIATLREQRFREGQAGIPALAEALELVGGRVPLLVEVKSPFSRCDPAGYLAPIVGLLVAYRGPVAAMSFDPEIVRTLRHLAPALPRGILGDGVRDMQTWGRLPAVQRFGIRHFLHWPSTRPDFIGYDADLLPSAAPTLLRRLAGVAMLAWTVRSAADRARALRHADQVIFEGFLPELAAGRAAA